MKMLLNDVYRERNWFHVEMFKKCLFFVHALFFKAEISPNAMSRCAENTPTSIWWIIFEVWRSRRWGVCMSRRRQLMSDYLQCSSFSLTSSFKDTGYWPPPDLKRICPPIWMRVVRHFNWVYFHLSDGIIVQFSLA